MIDIKTKSIVLYLVLILLYFLIGIFDQKWIFTDEFIYRSLEREFSVSYIESLLSSENYFNWIGFVLLPILILVKISFAFFCICTGAIFTDTRFQFKKILQASFIAEFVFLISQFLFSISLFHNRDVITIETAGGYFPLSVLSIYGSEKVVSWLHYPLQTLNLFEVAYILCISWLLSKQWKPNFIESINIVLPSYGIGLLIWMVLVVFLTLQIS